MTSTPALLSGAFDLPELAGHLLDRLRGERLRVHAITNTAAQTFTANLILAAGGIPSLTAAPEEVAFFTGRSGALLVNLGTLDRERRAAIPLAIAAAADRGRPWVLDPVFVDASPPRLALAQSCLAGGPSVLRCNAGEFAAMSGEDATVSAAEAFARARGLVVALTGEIDCVTDGSRTIRIANGHALMARVTAMGCAGTALVAAFAALHPDALAATAAALLAVGVAGDIAGTRAEGPGSFQPAFLDALFNLEHAQIAANGRVS